MRQLDAPINQNGLLLFGEGAGSFKPDESSDSLDGDDSDSIAAFVHFTGTM